MKHKFLFALRFPMQWRVQGIFVVVLASLLSTSFGCKLATPRDVNCFLIRPQHFLDCALSHFLQKILARCVGTAKICCQGHNDLEAADEEYVFKWHKYFWGQMGLRCKQLADGAGGEMVQRSLHCGLLQFATFALLLLCNCQLLCCCCYYCFKCNHATTEPHQKRPGPSARHQINAKFVA